MSKLNVTNNNELYYALAALKPNDVKNASTTEDTRIKKALTEVLLKDTHYLSKKLDLDSIISSAVWSVESSGDARIDALVKDKLWQVLNNDILQVMHEDVSYLGFGMIEIVYAGTEIVGLEHIDSTSLKYDKPTQDVYLWNADKDVIYAVDDKQVIKLINDNKVAGYPIGLAETCAPYVVLKYTTLFGDWVNFNKLFANPMIMGKYNAEDERDVMIDGVKSLAAYGKAVMPNDCDLNYIETKTSKTETFENIIDVCNAEISKALVGNTLTTDTQGSGSYSLGEVHERVRVDIANTTLARINKAINSYLIPAIMASYNILIYDKKPEFKLTLPKNIGALIAKDKELYKIGVRFTKEYYMNTYNLNVEDFELTTGLNMIEGTDESSN